MGPTIEHTLFVFRFTPAENLQSKLFFCTVNTVIRLVALWALIATVTHAIKFGWSL